MNPGWLAQLTGQSSKSNPQHTLTIKPIRATDYLDSIDNDSYVSGTPGTDAHTVNRCTRMGVLAGTFSGSEPFTVHALSSDNQGGAQRQIAIKIDGTFQSDITPSAANVGKDVSYSPGAGTHTFEIWCGQQSLPSGSNVLGNWVAGLEGGSVTLTTTQSASRVLVGLGDSIQGGGNCSSPPRLGYLSLIRQDYPGRVVDVGYGFGALANKTAAQWRTAAQSAANLSGATTIDFVIQFGTNDYGLATGQSAANYQTELGTLIDGIHSDFSSATVWIMEILPRSVEGVNGFGNTCPDYRTAQATVQSTRSSYCNLIANTTYGLSGTGGPDYAADGLHLSDSGHSKVKTGLKTSIGY